MGRTTCGRCFGRGKTACSLCQGSGRAAGGQQGYCPVCAGMGTRNCTNCHGSGQETAVDARPARPIERKDPNNPVTKALDLLCAGMVVGGGAVWALWGWERLFQTVGRWSAPLVDGLSTYLTGFVTDDLAKAGAVAGLILGVVMFVRVLEGYFRNGLVRGLTFVCLIVVVVAGVSQSRDMITTESFWFGPFAALIEQYW